MIRAWLKRTIARDELYELEHRRRLLGEYRQWLGEFPLVAIALDNMEAEAIGRESLNAGSATADNGPWTVNGLRDVMRTIANPPKVDSDFDLYRERAEYAIGHPDVSHSPMEHRELLGAAYAGDWAVGGEAMKERPIIFSSAMVKALLDGRKTQTRRAMKSVFRGREILNLREHGILGHERERYSGAFNDPFSWGYPGAEDGCDAPIGSWLEWCPYGVVGDRLWVREAAWFDREEMPDIGLRCFFEGDDVRMARHPGAHKAPFPSVAEVLDLNSALVKRSPIHMPRWASRLTLEITDIRVQRLQEISVDDAIAEGVRCWIDDGPVDGSSENDCGCFHSKSQAVPSYSGLWNSIHGQGSWEANPWVWALSFKRIDKEATR